MTNITKTFEELEFAGAMAIRFVRILEEDYDTANPIPMGSNQAGLSRIQHISAEVIDGTGAHAEWEESTQTIRVYDENGELSDGNTVEIRVMAVGRQ